MKKYKFLILVYLALGFLSACRGRLDIGDGGFLSEKPCKAPCFLGIIPDMTTKEQALEIFQQQFDISNCNEWPGIKNGQEIWCNPVNIKFSPSDKVNNISFSLTQSITMEEVIAKYGRPNAFNILGLGPGNNERTTSVVMLLFFDNIHMTVSLPEQIGNKYDVEPSAQIDWINYLGNAEWQLEKEDTQPWHGYGEYEGPYWAGP
jgi:hypothetical protein